MKELKECGGKIGFMSLPCKARESSGVWGGEGREAARLTEMGEREKGREAGSRKLEVRTFERRVRGGEGRDTGNQEPLRELVKSKL